MQLELKSMAEYTIELRNTLKEGYKKEVTHVKKMKQYRAIAVQQTNTRLQYEEIIMRILSRQQQMRNGYKEVGHIFDIIEGTPLKSIVKAQDSDKTLRKLAKKEPFWCGYSATGKPTGPPKLTSIQSNTMVFEPKTMECNGKALGFWSKSLGFSNNDV